MTSADQAWSDGPAADGEPTAGPDPAGQYGQAEGYRPADEPGRMAEPRPAEAHESGGPQTMETQPGAPQAWEQQTGEAQGGEPLAGEPAGAHAPADAGTATADGPAGPDGSGQGIPDAFGQGRHERDDLESPASGGQLPGSAAGAVQPGSAPAGLDSAGPGAAIQGAAGHDAADGQQPFMQAGGADREGAMARWREIQAGFVDDPLRAVTDADSLVGEFVDQIIRRVTAEREQLQAGWHGVSDPSTEDLRQGLRRYRSLLERLLGG